MAKGSMLHDDNHWRTAQYLQSPHLLLWYLPGEFTRVFGSGDEPTQGTPKPSSMRMRNSKAHGTRGVMAMQVLTTASPAHVIHPELDHIKDVGLTKNSVVHPSKTGKFIHTDDKSGSLTRCGKNKWSVANWPARAVSAHQSLAKQIIRNIDNLKSHLPAYLQFHNLTLVMYHSKASVIDDIPPWRNSIQRPAD